MIDGGRVTMRSDARRLRVDTTVRLRWLAVAGQSAAVLITTFGFGFALPFSWCFLVIALSAWLNIGLRIGFPVSHRLGDAPAFFLLAYDVLQLSALLYLTGGVENPFCVLFLAPVMISAASLSPRLTAVLALLTCVAASALTLRHLPLPWYAGERLTFPGLYRAGVWVAIVLGVSFISVYAARVAQEARQLSDALFATELVLTREQHLTQLDGLAAAAAHELGTPLATITLVVRELAQIEPPQAPAARQQFVEDVGVLEQEVARCRAILGKLASLDGSDAGPLDEMTVGHLIEEAVGPLRNFGVAVVVDTSGTGDEPVCRRNPGVLYGLGNLVENAIDFAATTVRIEARWGPQGVRIAIADDGPGFSPEIVARVGEPYLSSRASGRRAKTEAGLGLGLFIAKTLLERSGATVAIGNGETNGALVRVSWASEAFARGVRPSTKPTSAVTGQVRAAQYMG